MYKQLLLKVLLMMSGFILLSGCGDQDKTLSGVYYGAFDRHTRNILVFSSKHPNSVAFEHVEEGTNGVRSEKREVAMYPVHYGHEGTVTIDLGSRKYRLNIEQDKRTLSCIYCAHWPKYYRTTDSMAKNGTELHEDVYQQILSKSVEAGTNNGIE